MPESRTNVPIPGENGREMTHPRVGWTVSSHAGVQGKRAHSRSEWKRNTPESGFKPPAWHFGPGKDPFVSIPNGVVRPRQNPFLPKR